MARRSGEYSKAPAQNCLRRLSVSKNLSCHSEEHPKGTCFAARSNVGIRNLLVANSQKSVKIVRFGNRLPRQSADWLAMTGFFDSLCLSINPLYGVRGSFTQGELEGAKPASNRIKCRAKPCLARRAWSTPRVLALRREATIFVPQGSTKITTLFQAVEKSRRLFRGSAPDCSSCALRVVFYLALP